MKLLVREITQGVFFFFFLTKYWIDFLDGFKPASETAFHVRVAVPACGLGYVWKDSSGKSSA